MRPLPKVKENFLILYPEYFNSNLTRKRGRRVPKQFASPSPRAEQIFDVCRKLGLSPVLNKEGSFPSNWHEGNGRVKVNKKISKTKILLMVAQRLSGNQP